MGAGHFYFIFCLRKIGAFVMETIETLDEYWARSQQYWRSSSEFWARHTERVGGNSRGPIGVTELKNVIATEKCRCGCGESIEQPETGRKRLYASDSCRVRFNRANKGEA